MEFLFGVVVGFVLATIHFVLSLRSIIGKALAEIAEQEEDEEEETSNTLDVTVEQHEGQFLLYTAEDNRFLVQGTCMDDFINYAKTRSDVNINIINGRSDAAKALVATKKTQ